MSTFHKKVVGRKKKSNHSFFSRRLASLSDKQFLSEMAKVHPRITILYRMPTVKDLISCFRLNERTLVVLDDCDDLAFNDPFIARIFSQHANHARYGKK